MLTRIHCLILITFIILLCSFYLDKTFFVWATLFVVSLAFSDGSEIADDSVFDCLFQFSSEARQCYVSVSFGV